MSKKQIDILGWTGFGLMVAGLAWINIPIAAVIAGGLLLAGSIYAARNAGGKK